MYRELADAILLVAQYSVSGYGPTQRKRVQWLKNRGRIFLFRNYYEVMRAIDLLNA